MVFLQTKYHYSLISSTSGLYHHSTTSLEICKFGWLQLHLVQIFWGAHCFPTSEAGLSSWVLRMLWQGYSLVGLVLHNCVLEIEANLLVFGAVSQTPKVIYLVQLGQEIWRLRSAASNLSQRECKDDCNKVICDGVVQIGVHKIAPLSLHQIEQSWPCPQKAQSCYHKRYGTPFVLYKIHLCKYKNPSFSQQLLVNFFLNFFFFFLSLFLQENLIRRKIQSNSFSLQYQLL